MRSVRPTPFPDDPFVDSMAVIGQAIRAARTRAGLPMTSAAMAARVSVQTLVDVEAGKPTVGIGKLLQIADALGVSLFVVPAEQREEIRNQLRTTSEGTR